MVVYHICVCIARWLAWAAGWHVAIWFACAHNTNTHIPSSSEERNEREQTLHCSITEGREIIVGRLESSAAAAAQDRRHCFQLSLDFPHTTRQVWNEDLWIFICRQDHTKGRRSEEGSFEVSLTSICLAHCFQPDSWGQRLPAGCTSRPPQRGGPQHVNSFERKSLHAPCLLR